MINLSDLSVEANEFVPTAPASEIEFEPVQSSGIVEPEPYIQTETHEHFIQQEQPLVALGEQINEAAVVSKMSELILSENIPINEAKPEIEAPFIAQQPTEPEPSQTFESSGSEPVVAAAAIAATTAAVTAAAVGVAKAASPKTTKPTDAKKSDVKGKVAPIKKPTTTATSKLTAKPSTTTATKTTAAPRVASRTVAPKVGATAEKKTTTTTNVTRKPLSNGSK